MRMTEVKSSARDLNPACRVPTALPLKVSGGVADEKLEEKWRPTLVVVYTDGLLMI